MIDTSMNQTPQPKRARLAKPAHSTKRRQLTDLPYGLKDNVMDALEEAAYWHTVAIIEKSGKTVGTATAIRWRDRTFLITAQHVIRKTSNHELRFFFRPPGTLERTKWRTAPAGPIKLASPFRLNIIDRYEDPRADLAALELIPRLEREQNIRFYELPDDAKTPRPRPQTVWAIGFPEDSVERIAEAAYAFASSPLWANVVRTPRPAPDDFAARKHILCDFQPAQDGRRPHGFSGSGVWFRDSTPKDKVWMPNLKLLGIFAKYYPQRKLLRLVRVEGLLRFLKSKAKELRLEPGVVEFDSL
jgi:hypothetical protein